MTNTPDFRALAQELLAATQLYTGLNPAASEMSSVEKTEKLMDAMAATVAALATPPPEPLPLPDHWNLMAFAFGREPWRTWLQPGGRLESAHRELSDLMLAVLAHWGRPATKPPEPPTEQKSSIDELIAGCKPLDPEMAEALTTDARWRLFGEDDRAELATPPPEPPTDEELWAFWNNHDGPIPAILRAALERWGQR